VLREIDFLLENFPRLIRLRQGWVQPVSLGVVISVIFAGQVSQQLRCCKRDEMTL